jgi:hypothetical protein
MAMCPHCGVSLRASRRMLGDDCICDVTGKEFIIQEHNPNH